MKTMLASLLFIFFALNAFARIGETPEQCGQRYGTSSETSPGVFAYTKSGYVIVITFHEGKADRITYSKLAEDEIGKSEALSDNEIQQLLSINDGEQVWKKRSLIALHREWQTESGNLLAAYDPTKRFLHVFTKAFAVRTDAEKQARENKTLDGF